MKYKRILYKISGEVLMGDQSYGYNKDAIFSIAEDIKAVQASGVQICIVVGGGNIYRGIYGEQMGMERSVADYMGMLATVMNSIALQNVLESIGVETRVQSALPITAICEQYTRRRAIRHIEKNRIVIFAAGTGNPFFTTDTAATLRAMEMNCDCILKGTSVDGVYSHDPKKYTDAVRYETISYQKVIEQSLRVMDIAAIALARDYKIPVVVFSIKQSMPLLKVLNKEIPFSIIS